MSGGHVTRPRDRRRDERSRLERDLAERRERDLDRECHRLRQILKQHRIAF